MIKSTLFKLRHQSRQLGSALTLLCLGGSSLALTSCTTEEGVIAGALAGAAIGGLVGHSHERSYKRSKRHYRNDYNHYSDYSPRRSAYRGSHYSSYRGRGYATDPYCYC